MADELEQALSNETGTPTDLEPVAEQSAEPAGNDDTGEQPAIGAGEGDEGNGEDDETVERGPVPYDRFKEVNTKAREFESKYNELETASEARVREALAAGRLGLDPDTYRSNTEWVKQNTQHETLEQYFEAAQAEQEQAAQVEAERQELLTLEQRAEQIRLDKLEEGYSESEARAEKILFETEVRNESYRKQAVRAEVAQAKQEFAKFGVDLPPEILQQLPDGSPETVRAGFLAMHSRVQQAFEAGKKSAGEVLTPEREQAIADRAVAAFQESLKNAPPSPEGAGGTVPLALGKIPDPIADPKGWKAYSAKQDALALENRRAYLST
jgi:hypothetical protein